MNLGDYTISNKRIGKGGFSVVYLGEQKYTKQQVAVKKIDVESRERINIADNQTKVLLSREDIIDHLSKSGVWPNIIQRPFGLVADTNVQPKSIHISFFDSSPLAPNFNYIYKDELDNIELGLFVLSKLTDGKIHLNHNSESIKYFSSNQYQNNEFSGPPDK